MEKHQKYTFKKTERLSNEKLIGNLFTKGKSFVVYPIRVVYLIEQDSVHTGQNVKVLVSVSKKKFKSAVKRNRIKRLIREAYRLNKPAFNSTLAAKNKGLSIAFIYLDSEIKDYYLIEKKMIEIFQKLTKEIK
ncbi:MAG: ribonuclease P protein component [Candidatus Azobacteroides sp.]|nr:ribonuclease P protein component [Candidatus Azobacteroides sp.]